MTVQQPVASERIRDTIEVSALRNAPLALTCRVQDTWQNLRSRFLGMRSGHVWIEYPQGQAGQPAPEVGLGQKIGVSFKQRHHKYVFSSAVRETATIQLDAETAVRGLSVAWPAYMHQLQRRMFVRVDVPHDNQVFVDFWEGGLDHEPSEDLRDKLMYHGQLVDLSIGGFQVRLLGDVDPRFMAGAPMGVTLLFGDNESIRVDAQFRHTNPDEFGTTLGMQIVGLNETARGRKSMDRIGEITRAFLKSRRGGKRDPLKIRVGC